MTPPRRWQDQYLKDMNDDAEYDRVDDMLTRCPVCKGEGIEVITVLGDDGEPEPEQQYCSRCFATGRVWANYS